MSFGIPQKWLLTLFYLWFLFKQSYETWRKHKKFKVKMFCLRQGWGQGNRSPDFSPKTSFERPLQSMATASVTCILALCLQPPLDHNERSALTARIAPTSHSPTAHLLQELRQQTCQSLVPVDPSGTYTPGMAPYHLCWQKRLEWRTMRKAVFQEASNPFAHTAFLSFLFQNFVLSSLWPMGHESMHRYLIYPGVFYI